LIRKDCNAGFNFAKEDEAEKFYQVVMHRIVSNRKNVSSKYYKVENTNTNTTKSQISGPFNFQHIQHVGLEKSKFEVNILNLSRFFLVVKIIEISKTFTRTRV
jgi:hypothetical protein